MTGDQWQRGFKHAERGPMSLDVATLLYAWHSRHHVAQHHASAEATGVVRARMVAAMPKRALGIVAMLALSAPWAAAQSRWVHPGPDGKLVYAQSPLGDRIADFSYAGYRGGGIALPTVPAKSTLTPSGADDTAAIQAALDAVAKLPLVAGHRGAVDLGSGVFHCAKTVIISASGVVLRGAGARAGGTTIELTGDPHVGLEIKGKLEQHILGSPTTLTDAYVPSGSVVIHVADASQIHAGDTLLLAKPVTPAWLHFMGMDGLERFRQGRKNG